MSANRYSFVCDGGCGVCGVKAVPFEYSRTETLEGKLLESKVHPQIVSTCCGQGVSVYDELEERWLQRVGVLPETTQGEQSHD